MTREIDRFVAVQPHTDVDDATFLHRDVGDRGVCACAVEDHSVRPDRSAHGQSIAHVDGRSSTRHRRCDQANHTVALAALAEPHRAPCRARDHPAPSTRPSNAKRHEIETDRRIELRGAQTRLRLLQTATDRFRSGPDMGRHEKAGHECRSRPARRLLAPHRRRTVVVRPVDHVARNATTESVGQPSTDQRHRVHEFGRIVASLCRRRS